MRVRLGITAVILIVMMSLVGCGIDGAGSGSSGAPSADQAVREFIAATDSDTRVSLLAPEVVSEWDTESPVAPSESELTRVVSIDTSPAVEYLSRPWLAEWSAVQMIGTDFGDAQPSSLFWLVAQRQPASSWLIIDVGTAP